MNNICTEPFGANIHDILRQSFFLKDSFIGDFAQEKIKKIIDEINKAKRTNKQITERTYNEFIKIIKLIGEPIVRNKLMIMIGNVYNNREEHNIQSEIISLEAELKVKKQKLSNLKDYVES